MAVAELEDDFLESDVHVEGVTVYVFEVGPGVETPLLLLLLFLLAFGLFALLCHWSFQVEGCPGKSLPDFKETRADVNPAPKGA
jgi:hypothetical protein